MESIHRDFKGVWIPKEIWLASDLSIIEKCLLVEIDSLDNDPAKGCFASNDFLSKFIGVSEGRCANIISSLKKRGFIFQVFFDGRNRGLRLSNKTTSESSFHEYVKADPTDSLKHTSHIREHSNTDSNTTINTVSKSAHAFENLNNNTFPKGEKTQDTKVAGGPTAGKRNCSLEERRKVFSEDIRNTADPDKYNKDLLNDFYFYWTEPTTSGDKMRKELERTWDTSRRLATWLKRQDQFGMNKHKDIGDKPTGAFIFGARHNANG